MDASANYLQQILGTGKNNPCFEVYETSDHKYLHVYYGADLLEILPSDRTLPGYKLLVARLFNAGINRRILKKAFGFDPKTMARWGGALRSNDPELLVRALSGIAGMRKLTTEIQAFVRVRFVNIYKDSKKNYSQLIRKEIEKVFGVTFSGEALRPLFNDLKEIWKQEKSNGQDVTDFNNLSAQIRKFNNKKNAPTPATPAALPEPSKTDYIEKKLDNSALENSQSRSEIELHQEQIEERDCDIKDTEALNYSGVERFDANTLDVGGKPFAKARPIHHLGVLIFCNIFLKIEKHFKPPSEMQQSVKQWVAAVLLNAVNIEQSKMLNVRALELILGPLWHGRRDQRQHLSALAIEENIRLLFLFNAELVDAAQETDFYYDPHTKHYTGMQSILKGWCSGIRWAGKVMHLDFFHTVHGDPVYIEHEDNYDDLRIRILRQLPRLRDAIGIEPSTCLTLVVDRGIYSIEMFSLMVSDATHHLVTWEKNYQATDWSEEIGTRGSCVIERSKNKSTDIKTHRFKYLDQKWDKQVGMRRLRVLATNHNGNTIEVGVLTDDLERKPEELICLMFNRWVQENGFKYLDEHFGMKQITSYDSDLYKDIQSTLEDKIAVNGVYKALGETRLKERKKLALLLLSEWERLAHLEKKKEAKKQLDLHIATFPENPSSEELIVLKEASKKRKSLSNSIRRMEKTSRATRIIEKEDQIQIITEQMKNTQKEISKLEFLVSQKNVRLNTTSKRLMDVHKIISRNAFYHCLEPFKLAYDNFRDDHTYFRNLTQSNGWLIEHPDYVEVVLNPTANYSPSMRRIMEQYLENMQPESRMPNRSNKPITLRLLRPNEVL